jgi:hypothetical protein
LPRYVRCIKSNGAKKPLHTDARLTLEQLTYSGVFEVEHSKQHHPPIYFPTRQTHQTQVIQIRKKGYPYRLPHDAFARRYGCVDKSKTSFSGTHQYIAYWCNPFKPQIRTIARHIIKCITEIRRQCGVLQGLGSSDETGGWRGDRQDYVPVRHLTLMLDFMFCVSRSYFSRAALCMVV